MGQHHDKLISTDTRNRVGVTQRAGEASGHFAQDFITDRVTQRVVDVFEAVQVEKHHHYLPAFTARLCQRLCETILQQSTVWQAGQCIVQRQVARPFLGLQPFIDLFPELVVGKRQFFGALMHPSFQFLIQLSQSFDCVAPLGDILDDPDSATGNRTDRIDRSRLQAAPNQRAVTPFHAALELHRFSL